MSRFGSFLRTGSETTQSLNSISHHHNRFKQQLGLMLGVKTHTIAEMNELINAVKIRKNLMADFSKQDEEKFDAMVDSVTKYYDRVVFFESHHAYNLACVFPALMLITVVGFIVPPAAYVFGLMIGAVAIGCRTELSSLPAKRRLFDNKVKQFDLLQKEKSSNSVKE